jgi:hypothetical protein
VGLLARSHRVANGQPVVIVMALLVSRLSPPMMASGHTLQQPTRQPMHYHQPSRPTSLPWCSNFTDPRLCNGWIALAATTTVTWCRSPQHQQARAVFAITAPTSSLTISGAAVMVPVRPRGQSGPPAAAWNRTGIGTVKRRTKKYKDTDNFLVTVWLEPG